MSGDELVRGILTMVIAGVIGYYSLNFFSRIFTSSFALDPGQLFSSMQPEVLRSVANTFPLFIGGGAVLALAVLVGLTRR